MSLNNTEDIRKRLRMFRKVLKLSQADVAKAIGMRQASYSNIETGETKTISKSTIILLESKLNMNTSWLISGEGDMNVTENIGSLSDDDLTQYPHIEMQERIKTITLEYEDYKKMVSTIASQQETIRSITEKNDTAASV